MSSSDLRPRRVALLALLALGGCHLHPIYAADQTRKAQPELAAIEVPPLSGRRDQFLRNYLLDEFNPQGMAVAPAYRLGVTVSQQSNALAIQLDNTATRVNLVVGASFTLTRKTDGAVLYESAIRRVVSYNIRSDPFATLIAEQDAERRASREVAKQIRTILSVYFSERAA
jgi:LPS-assembly lipoprotein